MGYILIKLDIHFGQIGHKWGTFLKEAVLFIIFDNTVIKRSW